MPTTLILATDNRFWRLKIGSHKRIYSLYTFLMSEGISLKVFYAGTLYPEDRAMLTSLKIQLTHYENGKHLVPFLSLKKYQLIKLAKRFMPIYVKNIIKSLFIYFANICRNDGSTNNNDSDGLFIENTSDDFYNEGSALVFRHLVRSIKPDVVLVEYVRMSYLIDVIDKNIQHSILKIIDTMDIMYKRKQLFNEMGHAHDICLSMDQEIALLSKFDAVIAIQEHEANLLREMVPQKKVITAGHPHKVTIPPTSDTNTISLGFVGSDMDSNIDGVVCFLKEVWPVLKTKYIDKIAFNIYGGVCKKLPTEVLTTVTCHGFVEELNSVYKHNDIMVNPVSYGGGLKIKSVEALCFGKVLVTTPSGAEGIEAAPLRICSSSADFINTLSYFIESPESLFSLSEDAVEFAKINYTDKAVYSDLLELISFPRQPHLSPALQ